MLVEKTTDNQHVLGPIAAVRFISMVGSQPVEARIDTGSEYSSLHVTNWKILKSKEMVSFRSDVFGSDSIFNVPLISMMPIRNTDTTEYRPVIAFNIEINGIKVLDCNFNLSDRSDMKYEVLIGNNVLEKGKFIVDPSVKEDKQQADNQTLIEDENIRIVDTSTNITYD